MALANVTGLTPEQIELRRANAEAERWQIFGTEQTGQLAIETAQKIGSQQITRKCEDRDAATVRRINAPAWQFWR